MFKSVSPQQLVYGVAVCCPVFVRADHLALFTLGMPSNHVRHCMSRFLDSVYTAQERFHAADIRAKVSFAD